MKLKQKFTSVLVIIGGVVVLSSALLIPAFAQENVRDNIFSRVSDILNVNESDLIDAFKQAEVEAVNEAVENGRIDQTQAQEMIDKINEAEYPMMGLGRKRIMGKGGLPFDGIEEFLGIEEGSLRDYFSNDITLLEIAVQQGKSREELFTFLYENFLEKLDLQLESGIIDDKRYSEILENTPERINLLIDVDKQGKRGGFGEHLQ